MSSTHLTTTFSKFIPVIKVDEERRLVYGTMVEEVVDNSGEIFDYGTSKPYFEAWTQKYQELTDGASHGNLRAMHQPISAGKLTEMEFFDDLKRIDVCAKVVDDAEWTKVLEGVYTGFSIGGKYIKRWKTEDGVYRYTASPIETSLVDAPCIPTATFQIVKADGTIVEHTFATTQAQETTMFNNVVAAKARDLAKAAGDEARWPEFIEQANALVVKGDAGQPGDCGVSPAGTEVDATSTTSPDGDTGASTSTNTEGEVDKTVVADAQEAAEVNPVTKGDVVEQVWKTSDGATFAKKADAVAHAGSLAGPTVAPTPLEEALDALSKRLDEVVSGEPTPRTPLVGAGIVSSLVKTDVGGALKKGMSTISRLSYLIDDLNWVWYDMVYERDYEGDGSTLPEQLRAALAVLVALLRAVVDEETNELLGVAGSDDVALAASVSAEGGVTKAAVVGLTKCLTKEPVAARLAKVAELISEPVVAVAPTVDMVKYAELETANSTLQKSITTAVERLGELAKRVTAMEALPATGGPAKTVVVGKEVDAGVPAQSSALTAATMADAIAKMTPVERDAMAAAVIKSMHSTGGQRFAEMPN